MNKDYGHTKLVTPNYAHKETLRGLFEKFDGSLFNNPIKPDERPLSASQRHNKHPTTP